MAGGSPLALHLVDIIATDGRVDSYHTFLRGEPLPSGHPMRTAPRFQTSHADSRWLHRLQGADIGQVFLERAEVVYDVYAVR